jgi:hypothetical protein
MTITGIITALKTFFWWVLEQIKDFLAWIWYWLFDKICDAIEFAISIIELPGTIIDSLFAWASLPDQVLYILHAIGFPAGVAILIAAITLRFLINLIPAVFTRV